MLEAKGKKSNCRVTELINGRSFIKRHRIMNRNKRTERQRDGDGSIWFFLVFWTNGQQRSL